MRLALILAAAFGLATPALAQHAGHGAPPPQPPAEMSTCEPEHAAMGHCTVTAVETQDPNCPAEHAAMGHCTPSTVPNPVDPNCPPEHAAMGHCTPAPALALDPVDPNCPPEHAAMGHCTPARVEDSATTPHPRPTEAPPVAPPPAEAFSGPAHAADAVFSAGTMQRVRREVLVEEHGGMRTGRVLFDRLEVSSGDGAEGYAWDADAWYGSDYNRVWFKTEGEGEFGHEVETAEIQLLWSRPITPFFDLQAGVRHDIEPDFGPTHLVLGVQGLAPYWFEVDAAAFLSDEGDLTARFEAEYDSRITNKLILQPHAEVELSAGDIADRQIGGGLSSVELGLRLRYQIIPEFAPYVGVSYERSFGGTADYARARGDEVAAWRALVGLRTWF